MQFFRKKNKKKRKEKEKQPLPADAKYHDDVFEEDETPTISEGPRMSVKERMSLFENNQGGKSLLETEKQKKAKKRRRKHLRSLAEMFQNQIVTTALQETWGENASVGHNYYRNGILAEYEDHQVQMLAKQMEEAVSAVIAEADERMANASAECSDISDEEEEEKEMVPGLMIWSWIEAEVVHDYPLAFGDSLEILFRVPGRKDPKIFEMSDGKRASVNVEEMTHTYVESGISFPIERRLVQRVPNNKQEQVQEIGDEPAVTNTEFLDLTALTVKETFRGMSNAVGKVGTVDGEHGEIEIKKGTEFKITQTKFDWIEIQISSSGQKVWVKKSDWKKVGYGKNSELNSNEQAIGAPLQKVRYSEMDEDSSGSRVLIVKEKCTGKSDYEEIEIAEGTAFKITVIKENYVEIQIASSQQRVWVKKSDWERIGYEPWHEPGSTLPETDDEQDFAAPPKKERQKAIVSQLTNTLGGIHEDEVEDIENSMDTSMGVFDLDTDILTEDLESERLGTNQSRLRALSESKHSLTKQKHKRSACDAILKVPGKSKAKVAADIMKETKGAGRIHRRAATTQFSWTSQKELQNQVGRDFSFFDEAIWSIKQSLDVHKKDNIEKKAVIEELNEKVVIFEDVISDLKDHISNAESQIGERDDLIIQLTTQIDDRDRKILHLQSENSAERIVKDEMNRRHLDHKQARNEEAQRFAVMLCAMQEQLEFERLHFIQKLKEKDSKILNLKNEIFKQKLSMF